jgi:uncharacterized protein YbjT (DUF2867 family)
MTARRRSIFCDDLPTVPSDETGPVLVTGATGYIGGCLVPELVARGYRVRVMVRGPSPGHAERFPDTEVVVADALQPATLDAALDGVDTAYYLIHSLLLGPCDFAEADVRAACNFRLAAERCGVRRIVYLGGLGDCCTELSDHLRSRMDVAEALSGDVVSLTILRAAVIIGAGSASYEIVKHLALRLPVIFVPRWATNRCQPIAICDVVRYLVACLEEPKTAGRSFDIGGEDVLSYRAMLEATAALVHKDRVFVTSPISWLSMYGYVASLITPVPAAITMCLMEGLRNDAVCQEDEIKSIVPLKLKTFREAIVAAMTREEQDKVRTRWSDAYPPAHELAMKLVEIESGTRYSARYSLDSGKPADRLFASACRVGGKEGWFDNNWMWRLRGLVDRLLLGVGASRGRRSQSTLQMSDVIDFWRVEDIRLGERLLLRAEMKLPGKAWLEFQVAEQSIESGRTGMLNILAHYEPHGLLGVLYWYAFLPFHFIIFKDLLVQIEARA